MSEQLMNAVEPMTRRVDLAGLEIEHPSPFLAQITITETMLSRAINHLNNIQYVALIDRVAELAADAAGFTRERLLGEDRMWFVARHEIDFLGEVWEGQQLNMATWVHDVRRVKSWRKTVMWISEPDPEEPSQTRRRVVCRAATLWVLVNLTSRRPMSMDETMIKAFQPVTTDSR